MESQISSVSTSDSNNNRSIVVSHQRKALQGIKFENPFTFKVLQVFTGFGVGCGVGIGVGSPINLGGLPMVGQVMTAARGATDAFSGVSYHVNNALRKVGAKNIQAGLGCGVGFGHGFGVGLAIKPGVVQKIQASLLQVMMKMMMKFAMAPDLSIGQGAFPISLQSGMGMVNEPSIQNPLESFTRLTTKTPDHMSQEMHGYGNSSTRSDYPKFTSESGEVDRSFGRTEKVLSSFLQNPVLKEEDRELNDLVGRLRSENNMLQLVLKHQQVIDELMKENEKFHQILVEDLKVSPSKLQDTCTTRYRFESTKCFECRRKQRRRR